MSAAARSSNHAFCIGCLQPVQSAALLISALYLPGLFYTACLMTEDNLTNAPAALQGVLEPRAHKRSALQRSFGPRTRAGYKERHGQVGWDRFKGCSAHCTVP